MCACMEVVIGKVWEGEEIKEDEGARVCVCVRVCVFVCVYLCVLRE